MVRKATDLRYTHSSFRIEGFKGSRRYIIVDDLVCSGETVCDIYKSVKCFAPEAELVGMIGYNGLTNESIDAMLKKRRGLPYPKNLYPLFRPSQA